MSTRYGWQVLLLCVATWTTVTLSCDTAEPTDPDPGDDTPLEPGAWVRTGGPLGGLGYDIRMRPDNPDVMFVTDAWSGVFKSTDGGDTWAPSNTGITARTGATGDAIPIFSLTIDPHDPDVVWAGTQFTRGVFKSTDGGATWTEKTDGIEIQDGISFRGFTIDPTNPDVVYAAAELSSWVWNDEPRIGQEFDMVEGILYKTVDGGGSWTEIWRGPNLARYIWIDRDDPDVLYLSTGIFDREASDSDPDGDLPGSGGVYKSTDGGANWFAANNGLGNAYVGTLFMHPDDPRVLLAGAGNNQYWEGAGVYLTTDGAASWQQTLAGEIIESVEFAESDARIAYAGSDAHVYRSEDGGLTWTAVSEDPGFGGWGPHGIRAGFPIDFQVDPRDPDRIFANNYGGGNFLSTDGGRSWVNASRGYTGAQVRDVAVDPVDGERVFAAARSGIFQSGDAGGRWNGLNTGSAFSLEWYAVAIDPSDGARVLAANNWSNALYLSRSGGESWDIVTDPAGMNRAYRVITFAPSDPDFVYAGQSHYVSAGLFNDATASGGVYRSTDHGESWQPVNVGPCQDANVTAIAVHPADPGIVYAATGNRGLLRSLDAGESWTTLSVTDGGSLVALSVAISPHDLDVVFVGTAGSGLYRSRDAGESWERVEPGLTPEAAISDIVFHPTDPDQMFLADRMSGVLRSVDGGASWQTFEEGLELREVNALAISAQGTRLYAATEGRGVYRSDFR